MLVAMIVLARLFVRWNMVDLIGLTQSWIKGHSFMVFSVELGYMKFVIWSSLR